MYSMINAGVVAYVKCSQRDELTEGGKTNSALGEFEEGAYLTKVLKDE